MLIGEAQVSLGSRDFFFFLICIIRCNVTFFKKADEKQANKNSKSAIW